MNEVSRGGPPPECLNALQATTRRAPAAGTAVNIDIDIDIDSMFYEFLSDSDIDPLLNYVPGFVCEPPTMGRPCYLVKVQ